MKIELAEKINSKVKAGSMKKEGLRVFNPRNVNNVEICISDKNYIAMTNTNVFVMWKMLCGLKRHSMMLAVGVIEDLSKICQFDPPITALWFDEWKVHLNWKD